MPTLIAAAIGLSVAMLVLGALRSNQPALARRRVSHLTPETPTDPLGQSFARRVAFPVVSLATDTLARVLPARIVSSTSLMIERAGSPFSLWSFLLTWAVVGLIAPLMFLMLVIMGGGELTMGTLAAAGIWAAAGLYLPPLILRRKASARANRMQRDLPDAIDLVITNVEAGLGLQASLLTVAEKMSGPLAEEFGRSVREISLGRSRNEVFDALAVRSGAPDMRLFARAVAQSEQTGIPIARVLRNHSAESRERRRQTAREKAAKVPVKMTLPMVMFMFPTIFIVVLGPVVLDAMDRFGG